jgi:hypothetical protein
VRNDELGMSLVFVLRQPNIRHEITGDIAISPVNGDLAEPGPQQDSLLRTFHLENRERNW